MQSRRFEDWTGKPVAMLVEDDNDIAEMYAIGLAVNGYEVATVGCAEGALVALTRELPDVLVLDAQLPGIDGMALLSMIRGSAGARLPYVPAVFLTSSDEPALRARTAELGATEYLLKCDTPPRLLARVLDRVVAQADSDRHVEVVQTSEVSWEVSWCIRGPLERQGLPLQSPAADPPAPAGWDVVVRDGLPRG